MPDRQHLEEQLAAYSALLEREEYDEAQEVLASAASEFLTASGLDSSILDPNIRDALQQVREATPQGYHILVLTYLGLPGSQIADILNVRKVDVRRSLIRTMRIFEKFVEARLTNTSRVDATPWSAYSLSQSQLQFLLVEHLSQMPEDDPLAAAKRRGETARQRILAAQGELLDATEVAARLGLSVAEVDRRRALGQLLALPIEDGTQAFPSWQFVDGGLLPGLEAVLREIGVRDPWMQAAYFLSGDLRLDGQTPLEMLRRGEAEAVRRAAAAYGEQLAS